MTDVQFAELKAKIAEFGYDHPDVAIEALRVVPKYRALLAAVIKARDEIGNFRIVCPELTALIDAFEE